MLNVNGNITEQVDGYLVANPQSVSSLQAFPLVAEAFQMSNSTLPS